MPEINIPSTTIEQIESLTVDGKNPNVMTLKQREALKLNIQRYGFLIPIITNKDFVIAAGQHRLEIAKELGMQNVPIIRLDVDEVDRKILRQVLNKLRGEHDPELDLEEYVFLQQEDGLTELAKLLAKDEEELFKALEGEQPLITPGAIKDIAFEAREKVCPRCGMKL